MEVVFFPRWAEVLNDSALDEVAKAHTHRIVCWYLQFCDEAGVFASGVGAQDVGAQDAEGRSGTGMVVGVAD